MTRLMAACIILLICATLATSQEVRIMTFNIHYGRGPDGQVDLGQLAQIVKRADPHILLLNEVDAYRFRSGGINQARHLPQLFGYPYSFYGPTLPQGFLRYLMPQRYGNLLLSKYPLERVEVYQLPSAREPRNIIVAQIEIDGQSLYVCGTHLGLSQEERLQHIQFLLNIKERLPGPVVLLGDFNAPPTSEEIQGITAHFQDAHLLAGSGSGATFPSPDPRARIDYIFLSPALAPYLVETKTLPSPVSDHRPVLAVLKLKK
ncbi:MAG: endonuclease/exonuclease/phosphatase family protein [Limnochordia bacterium]|jgi:endonuclease/exonuclease/phosphatase family metal-dependent hydrolase